MAALKVYLFQTLQAITPDGEEIDLGSPVARSLFAYLVYHRERPIDRRRLAFLYWPDSTEMSARRNLRQYLHRIRRALAPVDPRGRWLAASGNVVQFTPDPPIWVDVEDFRQLARPEASANELGQALALYRGDLLEDHYENWACEAQVELRQLYLQTLDRLSLHWQELGIWGEAIPLLQRRLAAEPLDETIHRRLMQLYAMKGDRHLALQQYLTLRELLARELGSEPLAETQAVLRAIQAGGLNAGGNSSATRRVEAPLAHHPAAVDAPLVGRQVELQYLQAGLEAARLRQGKFLLVAGDSGIGKTRLIDEWLGRNLELPVLRGVCHELEALLPYAPLRQLLARALELFPRQALYPPPHWLPVALQLNPALAERFPFLPARLSPADDRLQIAAALNALFLALLEQTGGRPLALILDDLQWGDPSTWNFLAQLTHLGRAHGLLIIGLCRLEDLGPEPQRSLRMLERSDLLERIDLSGLDTAETTTLATALLKDAAATPVFLRRLHQETAGNPFFVIETLRAWQESDRAGVPLLEGIGQHPSPGLPLSIRRVIEARLDRLSPESQDLLANLAAIGQAFDLGLVRQIDSLPPQMAVRCLDELLQRGLLREVASGYDFNHEQIRQVAYARLSRARRQHIHWLIAQALEQAILPAEPTTLAYHYARSDQPHQALPYLIRAGELSLQARAYAQARHLGQQAISLLGSSPGPRQRSERIDLNLQLAQAYAFTGDLGHAQELLVETEHLALGLGDEVRLAQLFHRSAQIFWLRGQPALAGDYARRTLRSAEELKDERLLQAALRMLGRVSIARSAFDDAIAFLLRYASFEHTATPPPDLPIVLGYLGIAYLRVGAWGRALEAAQRGVALAEEDGLQGNVATSQVQSQAAAFARMQLGFVYADCQRWQDCLQTLAPVPDPRLEAGETLPASGAVREALRQPAGLMLTPLGFMLLGLRGLALASSGEFEGIDLIRTALDWADTADYRVFHYLPRKFLGDALLLAGEPVEALHQAETALEQARQAGNRWAAAISLRLAADAMTRLPAPDWTRVESYLIESMQTLREVRARADLARTYLALRRLYDRAGQMAWAVDCHFRAITIFEELNLVDELRQAQGRAAGDRRGAVVLQGLNLRGPNPTGPGL